MGLLAGKYQIYMFSSINPPCINNSYFCFSPSIDIYIQSRFTGKMAVFRFLISRSQYIYLLRNWSNKDIRAGWTSDNGILGTTLLWRAFLTHWAPKLSLTDTGALHMSFVSSSTSTTAFPLSHPTCTASTPTPRSASSRRRQRSSSAPCWRCSLGTEEWARAAARRAMRR